MLPKYDTLVGVLVICDVRIAQPGKKAKEKEKIIVHRQDNISVIIH
jgi:hypothetical protein